MADDIDAFIVELRAGRERLEAALACVPRERLESADGEGGWSVKDVLSHLTVRQSRLITLLFQVERGGRVQLIEPGSATARQAQNEADCEELKDRPLERVQADFRGVHVQLLKRVQNLAGSGGGFFDVRRHAALGGRSLADYVREQSLVHEEEHRLQIEAMLAGAA